MAVLVESRKACTVNPLRTSSPLGASYAFLGMAGCMPLMHGSQGCTSFGLVLLVRHFREAIPLQTTAMNEVSTILGGDDNLEQALLTIARRAAPALIGVCSTGLTEAKGDDIAALLVQARQRHAELAGVELVHVSTPDYRGAFQDGFASAVSALVRALAQPAPWRDPGRVNVLAGSHLTAADIDEVRDMIVAFGLEPVFLPDVSTSLDGHIPEDWLATTLGGTRVDQVRAMGGACCTLALGEQMRASAIELEMVSGVPYELFDRLTGLAACDHFLQRLSQLSGRPVPARYRRQRSQLLDAMLDGHFFFGQKRMAIAAEPDLLWAVAMLLVDMGAVLGACVTTTRSAQLEQLPVERVLIGDLEDLEQAGADCDLLLAPSHGRQAAERLGKPLYRIGFPQFDRLGNAHRLSVGYAGTRALIFDIGNMLIDHLPHPGPDSWPLPEASRRAAAADGASRELHP
jgi:nitrogenase molybdenum-iron protein NifN